MVVAMCGLGIVAVIMLVVVIMAVSGVIVSGMVMRGVVVGGMAMSGMFMAGMIVPRMIVSGIRARVPGRSAAGAARAAAVLPGGRMFVFFDRR